MQKPPAFVSIFACSVVTLLLLGSAPTTVSGEWPPSNGGGFGNVSPDVGLGDATPYRVAALADWDNDKAIDFLGISSDNASVAILLWHPSSNSFVAEKPWLLNGSITSIVVADINRDGYNDAVVHRGFGWGPCIILGDGTGTSSVDCDSLADLPAAASPSITVLDIRGDCASMDIVMTLQNGTQATLYNTLASTTECNYVGGAPRWTREFAPGMLPGATSGMDVNGNCVADIVAGSIISSDTVQYTATERSGEQGIEVTATWTVPSYVGAASWIDINGDGTMDIAHPSCLSPAYDKVLGSYTCGGVFDSVLFIMSSTDGADPCSGDDCCAGHPVTYASVTNASVPGAGYHHWPLSAAGCSTASSIAPPVFLLDSVKFPALLRPLDFNRDRFMDIVVATNLGPIILERNGGGGDVSFRCSLLDEPRSASSAAFRSSIPFFFDLNEDGRVDIVTTSTSGRGVWAYWNGIDMGDRYFMTATTLNGVKGGSTPFPSWGAAQVGATHRFQWQDINTNMRYATNTQFSVSQNHGLQMPHVHFGLGRTFSYVQNYATGMLIAGFKSSTTWPVYLIPNSQVVCFAFPLTDAGKWEIRLFVPTSRFKELVMYAIITALAVIGVPIVYLRVREIQIDKRDIMAGIN